MQDFDDPKSGACRWNVELWNTSCLGFLMMIRSLGSRHVRPPPSEKSSRIPSVLDWGINPPLLFLSRGTRSQSVIQSEGDLHRGYSRGVEVKRFRCRRNRRRLVRYGFELGLQFGFFALS
jgi:hypothetical protein